jgi:hypothetical protein
MSRDRFERSRGLPGVDYGVEYGCDCLLFPDNGTPPG